MKVGCEGSRNSVLKQSSTESWEYKREGIFEIFPSGLRVLVIDDDRVCLRILERMLKDCLYEVTKKSRAEDALSLLREQKNEFDIIISDVRMPGMDGFTLLQHVGNEMDLPVIMMSADDDKRAVMKGVTHGACDYLVKPVRIESLRNIWQHVLRKRKNELLEFDKLGGTNEAGNSSEGSGRNPRKNKDKEIDASSSKKPRVVWSAELHQQFIVAVNQLGLEKAVPKRILELMEVPGLTRENIASHLQKYRLYLRKYGAGSGVPRHPSAVIFKSEEANLASVNSQISPQNLETLFAAGQIWAEELATVNEGSLYSFERFEEEKEEKHRTNKSEPIELLHGIPTSIEPTQFANICQSMQPFGRPIMQANPSMSWNSGVLMQATQQLSRPRCVMNGASPSHVPRPIMFRDVFSCNNRDPHMNRTTILSSNSSFLLGSSSKGLVQNEANTEINAPRRVRYGVFNELNQHKSQECSLHNQVSSYHASQHETVPVLPSVLVNQGFVSPEPNRNLSIGGGFNPSNITQQLNTFHVENPAASVAESSYQNTIYRDRLDQEDLMTVLLKQQGGVGEQRGIGELEGEFEFGFTGFSLDDLPM